MAQDVAIGALDPGAHHARGKQEKRDGAGEMQQDDRPAHRLHRRKRGAAASGRTRMRITVMTMSIILAG
ncbi:hypothetical protein GCM10023067_21960 [Aminobacter aganoensis]